MQLQTRPLTFDEMYFKKPIVVHLPAPPVISAEANAIPAPSIDLSNEVFPAPPISNESPGFFNKYWPWILAGVAVAAAAGAVIYKKQQQKKTANSYGN